MTKSEIAYFSMEIGLQSEIPTYSGGLGVLAGDTIRSAADLKVRMVAVTLIHRKGYFRQEISPEGRQIEHPAEWPVEQHLKELPVRVQVQIEGRTVHLRAWRLDVIGVTGHAVPVLFLDSNLPENSEFDRTLTDQLYGGDDYYRLCQEVILGMGGVRLLRALGCTQLKRFHMNEGHASLLALELLIEHARAAGREAAGPEDIEPVREQCVFTTHTPVPAGHDRFDLDMARRVLQRPELDSLAEYFCYEGRLNMTHVALNLSRYVNGVAKKHAEVSRLILNTHSIDAITNGVHAATWAAPSFQRLFDQYIPGWREDNFALRHVFSIPGFEIWEAHQEAKRRLLEVLNARHPGAFQENVLTLGFARRAATYKRADLLVRDIRRLKRIARQGKLQIVYAGKAHPRDEGGKELIRRIHEARQALLPEVQLCYLENYDMRLGQLITAGVDVWVNTPLPPMEASGTSGMKAALNGVPNLSVLDGWWIEGCIEGLTGWAIGDGEETLPPDGDRSAIDAESLYEKLRHVVCPMFYREREQWLRLMRHSIALNGSFFNTQRMVQQYVLKAYF